MKQKVRIGIWFCVIGMLVFWFSRDVPVKRAAQTPKRIIFVTIDTLRRDHLSAYGWPRETSPFLRQLADSGVLFERAYTTSSHTAPSHTTMFTSRFPFEHGVRRNHVSLSEDVFSLEDMLQQLGFVTGALPSVRFLEGTVGFQLLDPKLDDPAGGIPEKYWYRSAKTQVNRAIHWLKQFGGSEKFFLWIHFFDVHKWQGTGQLPQEVLEKVASDGLQEKTRAYALRFSNAPLEFFKDAASLQRALDTYDARLSFVDQQLRRLNDFLSAEGLQDGLIWVVTADHGEGLGDHGYDTHSQYNYEEQLHVPFIVAGDGVQPNRVSAVVRSVDLLPTFADWLRFPVESLPKGLRGQSLLPYIDGFQSKVTPQPAFAERRPRDNSRVRRTWERGPIVVIVDGHKKLIDHAHADDEVFDLEQDPGELHNLRDVPESLREKLAAILRQNEAMDDDTDDGTRDLTPDKVKELETLGYL